MIFNINNCNELIFINKIKILNPPTNPPNISLINLVLRLKTKDVAIKSKKSKTKLSKKIISKYIFISSPKIV